MWGWAGVVCGRDSEGRGMRGEGCTMVLVDGEREGDGETASEKAVSTFWA